MFAVYDRLIKEHSIYLELLMQDFGIVFYNVLVSFINEAT